MAEKDYEAAQKAIDGIKLAFKQKKTKPVGEKSHPSNQAKPALQANVACDCCGTTTSGGDLARIDSGQLLCPICLVELRDQPVLV